MVYGKQDVPEYDRLRAAPSRHEQQPVMRRSFFQPSRDSVGICAPDRQGCRAGTQAPSISQSPTNAIASTPPVIA